MGVIAWILLGLVAGVVAKRLVPGRRQVTPPASFPVSRSCLRKGRG